MLSPSKSVLYQNLNQITELEKNLKRVSENVKCISKSGLKCKTDMKLTKALLKKKKLEVLALVAKSQAVLATMEVLIAENELEEMKSAKELREEKKKCEINGQPNPKKSKIEGGQVDKSKKPRKQSKKSPETSPKDKKLNSLSTLAPNENLGSSTPTTLAQKKTNDVENLYKSAPSYGKQLIVLSRPPIRSNVTCNQIGYLPNSQSLRHNKIENSIYNHAENIEQFAKTISLATNESFQKRNQPHFNQQGFYNQNVTSCQMTDFNQNLTDCNQNMVTSVGKQNLNQNFTTYQMSNFNRNNNMTVCNQNIANVSSENINRQMANFNQNIANDNRKCFYQNQTSSYQNNYNINQKNSLQDSAYQTNIANESEMSQSFEKISTDSSDNAYSNFLETTNQIFKDIMAKKGTINIPIKNEKDNIPDDNSENTLVIDIPSSIVY